MVERCPDKTEAVSSILTTRTMAIGDEPKPNTGPDKPKEGKEKVDLKILLADDDPYVMENMGGPLKLKYSSVEAVKNGKLLMGYLLAPGNKVDFLLTDYNMPEMNGLEALRQIRAKGLKDLPVIMMSGDFDYEDIQKKAEALGAVFLRRPVDIKDLVVAIEKLRLKKR